MWLCTRDREFFDDSRMALGVVAEQSPRESFFVCLFVFFARFSRLASSV